MKKFVLMITALFLFILLSAASNAQDNKYKFEGEKHLNNIRMLTDGGENAEAYLSFDEKQLIFQSTHGDLKCDQIFTMNIDGTNKKMVSNGKGRTTCSYFLPGDKKIIYASTQLAGDECPPPPDRSKGYVWELYKSFDIFSANADGTNLQRLTFTDGYDAEATVSQKGDKIVFTSMRDGDPEIYTMNLDGSDQTRLTNQKGYDGGAFFSLDGSKIVFRASRPKTAEELADYEDLATNAMFRPTTLEIYVMNADGSDIQQVTNYGKASFAPFFFPDGKRIIFSSNINSKSGRDFDLYMINTDGTGLEQITFNETFDGFPMFTRDGKNLVFCSNKKMKQLKLLLILILLTPVSTYAQKISNPEITAEEVKEHISYLASDQLKGRASGSKEIKEAADYIANEFKSYGLKPIFEGKYLQEFPFVKTLELTDNNSLTFSTNGNETEPKLHEDYITLPFSGNADVSGKLVFAGFGISAPDLKYDDYDGIDVKDKIVIVLRNTPEPQTPHSEFDAYSPLRKKASVARDKGALGIIFFNPYDENKPTDDLVEFEFDRGGSVTDFAVVDIKRNFIEDLFKAERKDLKEVYDKIIEIKQPSSFEFQNSSAEIKTEVKEVEATSWNVGGFIEGNDPELKKEWLIIGAHFDHLGIGGDGSLYRGKEPQIHNSADDKASGTAGVMEISEKFASQKDKVKRSIAFFTFSGE
ncbi:MAG: M28 family peptidase, partial [Ignavibacteriaceae bacterium]